MTSSPAPDLDELERLAKAALDKRTWSSIDLVQFERAASPDVILALITELRAAREAAAESGRLREALREWLSLHAVRQGKLAAGSTVIDAEELDDFLEAFATPPAPSNHGALDVERGRDEAVEAVVAWLNELGAEALAVAVQTRHWSNKQWLSLPRYVGTETLAAPSVPPEETRP